VHSDPEVMRGELVFVGTRVPSLRYDVAMSEYTAIVKQSGDYWIGWVEEVPGVNCQEATREELVDTLRITLAEALELNRADARSAAEDDFEEIRIAV
jgi:predicted RNase H-like HicB family nuclease